MSLLIGRKAIVERLGGIGWAGRNWFRDLDSSQDNQLQGLVSYRLDDLGINLGAVGGI